MGVSAAVGGAAELAEEDVRGLNSVAAMLSLGEPKGDGDAGRLPALPTTPGGSEDAGEAALAAAPLAEARLVVERLERVRFHGLGEARGEPDPMTPGCGRGLAAVLTLAEDQTGLVVEVSEDKALEPR